MAKKSISKSVRMTEDLYGFIMQAPGNGFNEKFENIVLRERRMQPEIDKMQEILDEKRREVYHLMDQHRHLDDFYRHYGYMCDQLNIMRRELEAVLEAGSGTECDE